MGCFNRNTSQWKDINSKFKSPIVVDTLITKWQKVSKSERIPELFEIESFLKQQNKYKKAKAVELKKSIENNVSVLGLNSKSQIERILNFWGIDSSVINMNPFSINADKLYELYPDIETKIKNINNNTHIFDIIEHMQEMFPDLNIQVVSEKEALEDYRRRQRAIDKGFVEDQILPEFKDVKSYYVGDTVMLIEGRIDSETAVEEVLHPLINIIYKNKKSLFKGLLSDAKKNFRQLNLDINNSYTDQRGFTQQDRDLELVTKAVSKTFNKEFDQQVTSSWRDKIKELLKYFLDIINDLSTFLTSGLSFVSGKKLEISPEVINSKINLTGLAKLLNTGDLQFRFNTEDLNKSTRIQFSLTKERESYIKQKLSEAVNSTQRKVIKHLTYIGRTSEEQIDSFSATGHLNKISTPLVIQDKKSGKYINAENPKEEFQSIDNILNVDSKKNEEFNKILEAKILGTALNDIKGLKDKKEAAKLYRQLDRVLEEFTNSETVLIPNIVLADASVDVDKKYSGVATTASIIAVHKNGSTQVINIKFGNEPITENYEKATINVSSKNALYDGLPINKNKKKKISQSMLDGIKANIQRRVLENMGFDSMSDSTTIYVQVDEKNNINVTNKFTYTPMDNASFVDRIVPLNINEQMVEEIFNEKKGPALDLQEQKEQTDERTQETLSVPSYSALVKQLKDYKTVIMKKSELHKRLTPNINGNEFAQEMQDEFDRTLTIIKVALEKGTADIAMEELLENSIKNVDEMVDYMNTPSNVRQKGYISKVLNFEKMANTYRGLAVLTTKDTPGKEDIKLTNRQYQLMSQLQTKLNTIVGAQSKKSNPNETYLIKTAIQNYIKNLIATKTLNPERFTEEDLDNLMKYGSEIDAVTFGTGTAATSGDPIMALMDKLFKIQHQKSLDRIQKLQMPFRRILTKLERLSPGGVIDYDFMSQKDEEGNNTGTVVKKIGYSEYWQKKTELYEAMFDGDVKQEYIKKEKLTKQEIEHNRKVYKNRKAFSDFMRAEEVIVDDNLQKKLISGNRHEYSPEFKAARKKHEVFVPSGKYGYWKRRAGLTDTEYQSYRNKWFFETSIEIAELDPLTNVPTGYTKTISKEVVKPSVDFKFTKVIKDEATDGSVQTDPKWRAIMNADPSNELAMAQKEFFIMYNKTYGEMLDKLPQAIRDRMYGKSPVIASNITRDVAKEGSWFTKTWSKLKSAPADWWYDTGSTQKQLIDEHGDFVDSVPIFYVGNPRSDKALKEINAKIQEVTKLWNTIGEDGKRAMSDKEFDIRIRSLQKEQRRIRSMPTKQELSMDHGANILKFIAMAENYEVMTDIKDTLESALRVMKERRYKEEDLQTVLANKFTAAATFDFNRETGLEGIKGEDSWMYARAKKWMHMVYYDNDDQTKGLWDKVSSNLIWLSSMTYVGWNPFGNLNNYAMGQMANAIESAGGTYFNRMAYLRATKLFNQALPGMMKQLGDSSTWAEFTGGHGKYKEYIPSSKYEALADHFRMMDKKADIREQNKDKGEGKSRFMQVLDWGFLIQDGVEYNVQTKVGMAILLTKKLQKRDEMGNVLGEKSIYDVYQYNNKTGELTMEEGYKWYMDDKGGHRKKIKGEDNREVREWKDDIRYEIRNYIREVNITMHGNYAHMDRMVIQSHWLGQLVAQFHKWTAPLWKQRMRKEYWDENLGWVEGRYRTAWSFLTYLYYQIGTANKNIRTPGFWTDPVKGQKRANNMKRNLMDVGMFVSWMILSELLSSLWDDDDEKTKARIRLENALLYQLKRSKFELQFFYPVLGWYEMGKMAESPVASTRTLGELGEALVMLGLTIPKSIQHYVDDDYNMYRDKYFYYQRGRRKGQSKLKKNWMDVVPILYAFNRWFNLDREQNFYIH